MSHVLVLDTNKQPLDPTCPARARKLLTAGKAAVFRRYPFTIILKHAVPEAIPQPLRVKIDPGSTTTGLAVVNDQTGQVFWVAELAHRGQRIRDALLSRRAIRRGRRQRHTRYRQPRFDNRGRPEGWLPPSLRSRVQNILTWVARLRRLCPIAAISQELVRFDTHLMEHPDISGVEYQQGELVGYEVREYVLDKWDRTCAYCDAKDVPLEIEHIIPKARGGSNRVSNLTLACHPCNDRKGTMTAEEFGHPTIQGQAKKPLTDAAAVNATRWVLYRRLVGTGLPVEVGTGGRTKWNRIQRGLPKTHWLDAACVGASTPNALIVDHVHSLSIVATGHGNRQMCGTDKFGFPNRHRTCQKRFFGFQTGDLIRATVPTPLKTAGAHVGRALVRASGSFDVQTRMGRVQGIGSRYCRTISRADGYLYSY